MTLTRKVLINTTVTLTVLFCALFFLAWNQSQSVETVRAASSPIPAQTLAALEHRTTLAWRVVIGVVLFVLMERWFVIAGSLLPMARNVTNVLGYSRRIASGDLRGSLQTDQRNEIGLVIGALNDMKANLASMVRDVSSAAGAVEQAARDIQYGSQDLSQRTEEQAASLHQTAASMREFAASVKRNAENARQAHELAQRAGSAAGSGSAVAAAAIANMDEISKSSVRMDEVITLIDAIAFQTNVLALNAAVEAARAGEQGRGFAVVAAEVRNLAQRSAAAAKEVRQLIALSREQINAGVASVKLVDGKIDELLRTVRGAGEHIGGIATACAQQADAVKEIDHTVDQLQRVTSQGSIIVQRSAVIADALSEEAQRLVDLVLRFQMDGTPQLDAVARLTVAD
jgi:methyl-accepting chemotaxis protein